jgi:hypothetical protein
MRLKWGGLFCIVQLNFFSELLLMACLHRYLLCPKLFLHCKVVARVHWLGILPCFLNLRGLLHCLKCYIEGGVPS